MNNKKLIVIVATLCLILTSTVMKAQDNQDAFNKVSDLVYGVVQERSLLVDLYIPNAIDNPPLLVWVHGGAWRQGSKEVNVPLHFLAEGYALASLDFRLSSEAMFPAQIHDIKAAIRYLRGNQSEHGYDAKTIAILGASSGGHLAALAGVTNGEPYFEGSIGDYRNMSSEVQAIVSYFGASNLTSILSQSTPHGLRVREPALDLFIGGQPEAVQEIARAASPVYHIDSNDPPLLLLHGDQDPQMPINQSHELHNVYKLEGLDVQFEVVHGAAHGGPGFFDEQRIAIVGSFLEQHVANH